MREQKVLLLNYIYTSGMFVEIQFKQLQQYDGLNLHFLLGVDMFLRRLSEIETLEQSRDY